MESEDDVVAFLDATVSAASPELRGRFCPIVYLRDITDCTSKLILGTRLKQNQHIIVDKDQSNKDHFPRTKHRFNLPGYRYSLSHVELLCIAVIPSTGDSVIHKCKWWGRINREKYEIGAPFPPPQRQILAISFRT